MEAGWIRMRQPGRVMWGRWWLPGSGRCARGMIRGCRGWSSAGPGGGWGPSVIFLGGFLPAGKAPAPARPSRMTSRRGPPSLLPRWFFGARARALLHMFLASGARASELLGMTVGDARPGDGRIYVATKGLGGIKQACPASPEAFSWLALYLGELAGLGHRPGPGEPLWWTRRRPLRPLTYTALRALLDRINEKIGANVTAHDLRHTLCLRLVDDPAITLVDAQQVMRHARITTTGLYLRPRPDEVIAKMHEHYTRPRPEPRPLSGWDYDPGDLADLFGQP